MATYKKGEYWRKDWAGRKRPATRAHVRRDIRKAYRNRCAICRTAAWKVDHIFPFFFGGSNKEYNLVLLCETCNKAKGAKLNGFEMRQLAQQGYVEAEKALRIAEWVKQDDDWIEANLPSNIAKKVLTIKHKYSWSVE